jgi:Sec-independent protein secretion pathway component TatC
MYGNLVRTCTIAAVVTVLPLLTRALLFRWRVPAAAFFGLSYAAIALASVAVRFALLPYLLRPVASAADGLLPMGDYLHVACNLFAAQALGAQLAVVLLFLTRLRRARGETGARAMLRLLGLCGGVLLVGALLTPPDPFSHWLFSLPLVALHVLATLAGRAFAGKTAAAPIS